MSPDAVYLVGGIGWSTKGLKKLGEYGLGLVVVYGRERKTEVVVKQVSKLVHPPETGYPYLPGA